LTVTGYYATIYLVYITQRLLLFTITKMAHSHNTPPPAEAPDRDPALLELAVWQEVVAAEKAIGTYPMHDEVPVLDNEFNLSNPKEAALASGFRRGRQILQAVSYGHKYWEMEYGLGNNGLGLQLDDEAFKGKHEGIKQGTGTLLQLVILSRVPVTPLENDEHWSLPTEEDLMRVKDELREELGVVEAHAKIWASVDAPTYPPEFPGVDDKVLIEAITAGKVAIGNLEQPDPQCWRP
jgi:hypothetical protein